MIGLRSLYSPLIGYSERERRTPKDAPKDAANEGDVSFRRPTGIGFELGYAIKSRPSGTCNKTILVLVGYGGSSMKLRSFPLQAIVLDAY
jgi:hypothetical protein